jgi:alanine racemase
MDLITFDVTDIPEKLCRPGDTIELIGSHHGVDELASEAGTIGYEILTSLGARYHRQYLGQYVGQHPNSA